MVIFCYFRRKMLQWCGRATSYGCKGCSIFTCGFFDLQMRPFSLFTKRKWASWETRIFDQNAHLQLNDLWPIGRTSFIWIFKLCRPSNRGIYVKFPSEKFVIYSIPVKDDELMLVDAHVHQCFRQRIHKMLWKHFLSKEFIS